jgi:hypothetical protein
MNGTGEQTPVPFSVVGERYADYAQDVSPNSRR